ncbi:hypothetical protein HY449_02760 [Candidatus Pacearchaeota archaeon]|nr:hypothetical protein [Candidatus Pacearchaeota archaeon]
MRRNNFAMSLISLIFFSGFASAQFYGGFSLGNFLSSVDPSTIVLGLFFVIFFLMIRFALGRVFKGNEAVSNGISLAVSLLIIWGINQSGFNYYSAFGNIFFFLPTGFLEAFWPLILVVVWILLIVKNGLAKGSAITMILIGGILVLMGLTENLYEQGFSVAIGVVLIIAGIAIYLWGKDKKEFKISV